MNDILKWLPLGIVTVASATAWGVQAEKVSNLEQQMQKQQAIVEQQIRIDERTKQILQLLEELKRERRTTN